VCKAIQIISSMCVNTNKRKQRSSVFGNTYKSSFFFCLFLLFQRNVFRVLTTLLLLLSLFVVDVICVCVCVCKFMNACYSLILLFFFSEKLLFILNTLFVFSLSLFCTIHTYAHIYKKKQIRDRQFLL
jgi:hypothetical protein